MNSDLLDFSSTEWKLFSLTEKRIILLARKHQCTEERIRELINWPEEPMKKTTFRGHYSRIMRKIVKVRTMRMKQNDVQ